MLGVPAHANSNQRFLTVEAFRAAGFEVLGILNEPSAASIEFGHRQRQSKASKETILVYDLGGGTFDASLVTLDENVHHVIASEGIPSIGGDDFDHILADLALDKAGVSLDARDQISAAGWFWLLDECRLKKETLNPNSRRLAIDLEPINSRLGQCRRAGGRFLRDGQTAGGRNHCRRRKICYLNTPANLARSMSPVAAANCRLWRECCANGLDGACSVPPIRARPRLLGSPFKLTNPEPINSANGWPAISAFGAKLIMACGLYLIHCLKRASICRRPEHQPLAIRRCYSPVHNSGHFRFLECSHRAADGGPSGEVTMWDEIYFPFDPALQDAPDLEISCLCNILRPPLDSASKNCTNAIRAVRFR